MVFTAWTPWEDRDLLRGAGLPGVCLLAHFTRVPQGLADPLAEEIVYIGETCDNSLKRRWYPWASRREHRHEG